MKTNKYICALLLAYMTMLASEEIYSTFWAAAFVLALTLFFDLTQNKFKLDKLITTAIISALALAGRILFLFIPPIQHIQLAPFIIIISGIVFGPSLTFEVGLATAVVSSFVIGFDKFILWQVFAYGLIGLVSWLLSDSLKSNKIWRVFFALLCGIGFGWTVNLRYIIYFFGIHFRDIYYVYLSSVLIDVVNGCLNAFLMLGLGDFCIKKFVQIIHTKKVAYRDAT